MSNLFDVLYNNITSNQAPGLNEYEKSVFLTKAQDEIVKNYFLPQSNPKQAGFDGNPKRQIDFSMLMSEAVGIDMQQSQGSVDPRAITYKMPNDIMYIINESIIFTSNEGQDIEGIRQVIPLSYEEYTRLMSKPFKYPLKQQAWRIMVKPASVPAVPYADVILTNTDKAMYTGSGYDIIYKIRYVMRPVPIILVNLTDNFGEDLKIHGISTASDCMLDPEIHEEIVQRAVELAKVAWTATGNDNAQMVLQAGQRSE